jgi:NAD(P)-dependent dehydrogenase (short-subunit alcohol dehydrogenase family)
VDLKGKVAIVTGGAGAGTGRSVAFRLAREGAAVIVADIDSEAGKDTVSRIETERGRAAFVRADVRVGDDVERMVQIAEETCGGLDILVNNAGDTLEPHFPDASPDHWRATVALNLLGPMLATQVALKSMERRGGGAIVNIASVAGLGFGVHDSPEYAAAKAGLIRFTATLAPLKERMNVRINCVVPHWIETDRVKEEIAQLPPDEQAQVPKLLQPEEVADAVLQFLVDDDLAGRVMVMWCEQGPRLFDAKRKE